LRSIPNHLHPRTHALTHRLTVDGSATAYRLFDVGYSIALDRAAELLGVSERVRPRRAEARAIQISNPPLLVHLGSRDATIGGQQSQAQLSAHIFDFGVCSMQLRIPARPSLSWEAFSDFGRAVATAADIDAIFERDLEQLLPRLSAAVERPGVAPLSEEYFVFRIDRVEGNSEGTTASERFADEQIVPLLLGEDRPLSHAARKELLPHRFSYYDDDLTVLTWDNALVVEPRTDDRDVEYVLEFANAQLLELRMYDAHLDAELPPLYDRIALARGRRRARYFGRLRTVLSDLQTRLADVTETIERVENALKVTDDVYLARIYAAALALFREDAWRVGLERKLRILREAYSMLHGEAQAARSEALEVAIVVLILVEIILGLTH
jgi:hypothetical protein